MNKTGILTWDLLSRNLKQQVASYSKLNELLVLEKQILIKNKVQELTSLTPQKDFINSEIETNSDEFKQILKTIVVDSSAFINLDEIISVAPDEYKVELRADQNNIRSIYNETRRNNYINKGLIENSMKYVSYMMKKIIEVSNDDQKVYCNRGYMQSLGGEQNYMSVVA